MEGEFQYQRQLEQDQEEWLSPRASQSVHGLFSEQKKQESIWVEDSAPEREIIGNIAQEGEAHTMSVIKCS